MPESKFHLNLCLSTHPVFSKNFPKQKKLIR
ncbi:hypothetical protein LA635_p1005 (plasmid) [Erwinia amylovora LA635]|uniref:Uncharacterized protein n=1 Tax=Erwinia amylovora TaxID=552 RepID=A0A0P0ZHF9_ERWAM|nr:hypothetical protein LA635_p1005 [Erwinia amylovora LA635]CDK23783.1 hypothetical protein LA636_p1005 [Erwinia amylovora LA636]CDK23832.1 hypothetical protein LA637_p1005 [Erwinia amylovora LA637]CDM08131.1 hypothetical protein EAMY692_p20005 [Erwinia amylovora]